VKPDKWTASSSGFTHHSSCIFGFTRHSSQISRDSSLSQFPHHGFRDLQHFVAANISSARRATFNGRIDNAEIRHDAAEDALQGDAIDLLAFCERLAAAAKFEAAQIDGGAEPFGASTCFGDKSGVPARIGADATITTRSANSNALRR